MHRWDVAARSVSGTGVCGWEGLLTSSWLCAGVVVVLVLTSQIVGTVSRLSVLMKEWASAYSDSESAGEENRELVERSSMQDRSWRQRRREEDRRWWVSSLQPGKLREAGSPCCLYLKQNIVRDVFIPTHHKPTCLTLRLHRKAKEDSQFYLYIPIIHSTSI